MKKHGHTLTADNETDFIVVLSFYAFSGFLVDGRGMVEVRKAQLVKKNGHIKADAAYLPLEINEEHWDEDIVEFLREYDPCKELVLDTLEEDGRGRCALVTPKDKHLIPQEAYRTGLKEAGVVPIVPGTVVNMKAGHGFEARRYVYIDQEKNALLLMVTADKDGKAVLTGESFKLHVNHVTALEETGQNMWEQVRAWRKRK